MDKHIIEYVNNNVIDPSLNGLFEQAQNYAILSRAKSTIRRYTSAWNKFLTWCTEKNFSALPSRPEIIALYLTDSATQGSQVATLQVHLSAICHINTTQNYTVDTKNPILLKVWEGIRRSHGIRQQGKEALFTHDIRGMVMKQPQTLRGIRNKAIILLGFSSACRRSELTALNIEDITFTSDGIILLKRKSKTDQEGRGITIAIPFGRHTHTCPVLALKTWLEESKLESGALFRSIKKGNKRISNRISERSIATIIKEGVLQTGLEPEQYSAHSLRSGHVTTALAAGVAPHVVMKQTTHRNINTLIKYERNKNLFAENSCSGLGL